jgi:hypothetical protein
VKEMITSAVKGSAGNAGEGGMEVETGKAGNRKSVTKGQVQG